MRYKGEGILGELDNKFCQPRKNSLSGLPRVAKWITGPALIYGFCHGCGVDGVHTQQLVTSFVVAALSYTQGDHTVLYHLLYKANEKAEKFADFVEAKMLKRNSKLGASFQHASANIVKEGMERACKVAEEMAENNPNSYRAKETLESNNANVASIRLSDLPKNEPVPQGVKIVLYDRDNGGR